MAAFPLMTGRWLTVAQAAAAAGVAPNTMRRRLLILAEQHPGLLRSFARSGPSRKYFIDAVVLERALGAERPGDIDSSTSARIEELESKLLALRNAHVALRKRVAELEATAKGRTLVVAPASDVRAAPEPVAAGMGDTLKPAA